MAKTLIIGKRYHEERSERSQANLIPAEPENEITLEVKGQRTGGEEGA